MVSNSGIAWALALASASAVSRLHHLTCWYANVGNGLGGTWIRLYAFVGSERRGPSYRGHVV